MSANDWESTQGAAGAAWRDRPPLDEAWASAWSAEGGAVALHEPAPEDEVLAAEPAEQPLARYAWWQVRDWLTRRATLLVPLALFAIYMLWRTWDPAAIERAIAEATEVARKAALEGKTVHVPTLRERFMEMVWTLSVFGAVLGSVVASFGLVSTDRERGYQRFLFAKPVSIARYYLQKLGVAYTGLMLTALLLLGLVALVFGMSVPVVPILVVAGSVAACMTGLVFLLSTLVRFDGPLALALTVGGLMVNDWARDARSPFWVEALRWLLPPLHVLEGAGPAAGGGDATPVAGLIWLVAYGVACVVAGLVVLRRRSITV